MTRSTPTTSKTGLGKTSIPHLKREIQVLSSVEPPCTGFPAVLLRTAGQHALRQTGRQVLAPALPVHTLLWEPSGRTSLRAAADCKREERVGEDIDLLRL